jgi:hypothetical protein
MGSKSSKWFYHPDYMPSQILGEWVKGGVNIPTGTDEFASVNRSLSDFLRREVLWYHHRPNKAKNATGPTVAQMIIFVFGLWLDEVIVVTGVWNIVAAEGLGPMSGPVGIKAPFRTPKSDRTDIIITDEGLLLSPQRQWSH